MNNRSASNILVALLFVFGLGCRSGQNTTTQTYTINKSAEGSKGMVVSAHPFATQVGLDILKKGGNAVDAAIAVQFALAVCYPVAGNIGGGGFMVYVDKNGNSNTLDFREMAPAKAFADMYLDAKGDPITELSINGPLAGGVPGTVAGMWEAYSKYSKLKDWKALVMPAVLGAKNGVILTSNEAQGLNNNKIKMDSINHGATVYTKQYWKTGDVMKLPELAATLSAIAEQGPKGFYEGKVASQIANAMQKDGGIITLEDLKNYKAVWRNPIITTYRGQKVVTMPPPSSGGMVLVQLLKSVEPYNLKANQWQSATNVHLMVEAERRSYADRATHMGDMDYYPVPMTTLTSDEYIASRMKNFDPNKASKSDNTKAGNIKETEQTTHYNVVDAEGNAVSITTTLNGGYGSKYVIREAGFLLNNEMDDFSVKPGVPNLYGLIGNEANKIEPGKRMLSSMTPAIVLDKNGKPNIIVGTPGGSTIITSVFQTIINIMDFGMAADEAVARPRFHHQWMPDVVMLENDCLTPEVKEKLKEMGHNLVTRGKIGRVEAIIIKDGKYSGGADPRGDDDAKGY